jgi:glutamate racemase
MKEKQSQAIGIFDSGIGGLTVMREIMKRLPHENLIYYGDTARLPYGDKSKEVITRYSMENTIFLMEQNIKLLVVACNTASALALEKLQRIFNIPILGVIEPGAENAVKTSKNKNIAVLGTKGTIKSGVYQREIEKKMPQAKVISIACPLFVPLVEERFFHHPAAGLIIKEYLFPLKDHQVDTVLLGCTHYPLLKQRIMEELLEEVSVVDAAFTCALKVAEILKQSQLENGSSTHPEYQYFVSDDPIKFQSLGIDFLGMPIKNVILNKII